MLAAIGAAPAMAEMLVVSSSGPSAGKFRPGTILAEGTSVELKRSDQITILDVNGTRVLQGPQDVVLSEAGTSSRAQSARLSAVLTRSVASRSRIGATRGSGDGTAAAEAAANAAPMPQRDIEQPTSLWQIDPARAGNWCYFDAESVELWRNQADDGLDISFQDEDGQAIQVRWGEGEDIIYWPYSLFPRDGQRYFVQTSAFSNYISLHQVELQGDMVALAEALDENECFYQLDKLAGSTG